MPLLASILAGSVAACVGLATSDANGTTANVLVTALQQSRSALGSKALRRGGVLVTKSTTTVSGLNGSGNSAVKVGGMRLAERSSTPPIATADGYDGRVFWNQDQSGLVWTDGSDAGVSQEIDAAYAAGDALFVPGSGGARVAWGGIRTAGGRRYVVLTVTPHGSLVPINVWIDAASHLPARYLVTIGATTYEKSVSDYRPVDGLLVPYRIVSQSSDGNSSAVRVTSARIVADDESAFVEPESSVHDFSIDGTGSTTAVRFDLVDNHVYLDATIDGKGPYRFVFDTGGSNIIDPSVAKAIGAVGSGSAQDTGTGSGTESFSYATIHSLRIGNAELRDQVFSVEPLSKGTGEHLDGLIGFEVLARFVTTFDYARQTLTFAMPGAAPAAAADTLHFKFFGTIPQIGCTVDGIASQCTVDTGDAGSVNFFAPFVMAHSQVIPPVHSAVGVNGYGVGGGHLGFMGRLRSLGVGTFELRSLVAGYPTELRGGFALPFLAANLGGGTWKRFTVTFDYGAETMVLQANTSFADPDGYDRSGMTLIQKDGNVVVYAVRPGTPAAAAGVAKGDVVRSIDGVPLQSLAQTRGSLRGAPGTVLQLQIVDKTGLSRAITLTLRDWV